jgi:hypothetical protein
VIKTMLFTTPEGCAADGFVGSWSLPLTVD